MFSSQVYIPKWALNVMQLSPQQRSESDVKRIVSLLRLFKGFKDKFSTEAQEEFGRNCEYTWYLKFKCIKATYVCYVLGTRRGEC